MVESVKQITQKKQIPSHQAAVALVQFGGACDQTLLPKAVMTPGERVGRENFRELPGWLMWFSILSFKCSNNYVLLASFFLVKRYKFYTLERSRYIYHLTF